MLSSSTRSRVCWCLCACFPPSLSMARLVLTVLVVAVPRVCAFARGPRSLARSAVRSTSDATSDAAASMTRGDDLTLRELAHRFADAAHQRVSEQLSPETIDRRSHDLLAGKHDPSLFLDTWFKHCAQEPCTLSLGNRCARTSAKAARCHKPRWCRTCCGRG